MKPDQLKELRERIIEKLGAYADYCRIHDRDPKCLIYRDELADKLLSLFNSHLEAREKEIKEKVVKEFEWYSRHDYQTGYVQFNTKEYEDLLKKLLGKEEAK